MKKTVLSIFFVVLFTVIVSPAQESTAWELSKSGDGITAYSKISDESDIHEFKAIAIVDARLEVVAQIIRDVPGMPQWMAFCDRGDIIERFDENNMIVHIIMDFPVVSDRDLVVKADTVYDMSKARGIVTLNLIRNSPVPVPEGMVRMAEFSGTYRFEYITRERTGVIFTYRANPGGRIPSFITNIFSKHLLYDTLKNLKNRMVHIEQYKTAAAKSNDRALFEGVLSDREKVRGIMKARMKEYYRDHRSIDKLLAHDEVMENFLNGDASRLTELVFYSQGSRSMLTEAARGALALVLKITARSGEDLSAISNDPALSRQLIEGTGTGGKCVYDIVMERAHDSLKDRYRARN